MTSTARRLLVATPALLDPNFLRTVVFMIEHTPEAALGVVLNRPSEATLEEALPEWWPLTVEPRVAFVGGPVQTTEALIGIGRAVPGAVGDGAPVSEAGGWFPLLASAGTVDLGRPPSEVGAPVEGVRVFAGYAAWGPGQLDGELEARGWYVVDAEPDDLFTAAPETLWRRVLRRQRGELAIAANAPLDPRTN